ncbi:hypothetical protein PBI_GAIA_101 [Mycobacterium phage Gaia]|uniref:Uncharacterized protein n=1 Tax=Mycobacterium phage Gaia TaxID=1486472 RepID=A0A068F8T1_9CAUD|nr:hypothetical protein VC46_gp132 [Mycobacterium phage Gaia]AID58920.1 hypothetical protein PBI_GAIA_101 [Mycobacterium phage Gaia]AYR00037.1 hypothetical protein PBI_NEBKISS_101 [Mycobacterium phage Nebkiss]
MRLLRLVATLELDEKLFPADDDEWLIDWVLQNPANQKEWLSLFSADVGDMLGEVSVESVSEG